jgi:Calx-beta domain
VIVDGNVFENCWTAVQIGYAVLFTVRSEEGRMPWATVENISFTNNTVKNTDQGLQLRGADHPFQSGRSNGLMIANNLFVGIVNRFYTVTGFNNVTINHNTHLQSGNVTAFFGEPSIGFAYTNNITVRSGFGFFGDNVGEGTAALTTYAPGAVFQKNLIAGASPSIYPANNFFPSTITGVLDSAFQVVDATYKSAGTDGKDLGCDINALNATQSGAGPPIPTPTPTPTPTPVPTPTPTPAPLGVIQFSAASYSVNEDAGSVTITVTRSGSTSGSASVQYATSDGNALSPGDYNVISGTITFAAGETSKSFAVSITDDIVRELNESFNVVLSNESNANLGSPASASVNIVDNDKRGRGPRVSLPRVGARRQGKWAEL